MAEFLDLLEKIKAGDASVQRIFGGEGKRVRSDDSNPRYKVLLSEAMDLLIGVKKGKRPTHHLTEAMTTSDFPLLFGDIIDRQILGNYTETPSTWQNFVKKGSVRDFRTVKRFSVTGAEGVLEQVNELTEYPEASLSESKYEYAVRKYGRRIPFSWESIINDDLGALDDIPLRFARAARRTEQRFAIDLLFDVNGPDATHFSNANKNIVNIANGASQNNPPLSVAALQQAMTVLSLQRDTEGEPIFIETIELIVPPALRVVAENMLNALQLEVTEAGGTSAQTVIAANWMKVGTRLNVEAYIPLVASTANGNTSWILAGNPSSGRPTAEVGFLRAHEAPELYMKEPNARRVGGGMVDPMAGDFDIDAIEYKIRHVLGGSLMEPKSAVASNGSGA